MLISVQLNSMTYHEQITKCVDYETSPTDEH